MPGPNLLCFVHVPSVEASIGKLVQGIRPTWIFDLRAAPRMDFDGLTRSYFFQLIQRLASRYVDVFGTLGIRHYHDSLANGVLLAETLNGVISESDKLAGGPFMFLVDRSEIMEHASKLLPNYLKPQPREGWQISMVNSPRNMANFA